MEDPDVDVSPPRALAARLVVYGGHGRPATETEFYDTPDGRFTHALDAERDHPPHEQADAGEPAGLEGVVSTVRCGYAVRRRVPPPG